MTGTPIQLISSISSSIQDLKGIYEVLAPLRRTLLSPGQRQTITELQDMIQNLEAHVQELRSSVSGLSNLIRAYSELIGDVRVAAASSDKFSEMIEMQPDLLPKFKTFFTNIIRDEYSRVASGIPNLPKPSNTESAQRLGNLEIISRNLRDLVQELRDTQPDSGRVVDLCKRLSTQYSDMAATLSELIRELINELEAS